MQRMDKVPASPVCGEGLQRATAGFTKKKLLFGQINIVHMNTLSLCANGI